MLGDNEEITEGAVPERAAIGPNRGAMVVPDRGRGYGAFEWYGDEAQEDSGFDLQKYLRILQKHWLVIAASIIVAIALGVAKTLLTTPIYTATVVMQIDREAARVGNLNPNDSDQINLSDDFFETQHGLLKSRQMAVETVDRNDLANDQGLITALGLNKAGADGRRPSSTDIRNRLIGMLQGNVDVLPMQRSRLVRVTFDSPSPQASQRIVNAIADSFIKWNLDRRLGNSDYARKFLEDRMAQERSNVENSERELAAYANEKKIINITPPSSAEKGGNTGASSGASTTLVGSSLLAGSAALDEATRRRIAAQQKYEQSLQPNQILPELIENASIQAYKAQLQALRARYQTEAILKDDKYPTQVALRSQIADTQQALDAETAGVLAAIKATYEAAKGEEEQQQKIVADLTKSYLNQNSQGIEFGLKQMTADTSKSQYGALLEQYKEVSTAGGISTNNISIVDPAQTPHTPSKPQPKKNVFTAAMIGLFVGVALALVIEYLDESIRMPDDVERKLGLPLLGTVPKLERGMTPIEAISDVRSAFSEAYYSVRTALQFSTDEGVPSSLLITSARPMEGKSTSAVSIAQNFARLGLRVLLIDGDLRNPSLHRTLQMENNAGFSNYLTGGMPLSRIVQPTSTPCLSFIPCGPLPPNPAELLAGSRAEMMLREARSMFDIVVVDGPPIMGLADGPLLASVVSGTVIVIEAGGTGRNLARVALRRLNVGAPRILGVLLTKFDAKKSSYGYGYGYGYAYDYAYGNRPQIKGGN